MSAREVEAVEPNGTGLTGFVTGRTAGNHIDRVFAEHRPRTRTEAVASWLGTGPRP